MKPVRSALIGFAALGEPLGLAGVTTEEQFQRRLCICVFR